MQALLGIVFHITGGIAAGSFYMPYKKVRDWNWESYWIVGGLFSWLVVPFLLAWITLPGFWDIIVDAPFAILKYVFLFGVLWGIGGLTFGLGIRYLGMSLGISVMLGLSLAFGALVPTFYYDVFPSLGKIGITEMINSVWGQTVLAGIVISLIGIIICGKAGMMKEKQLERKEKDKASTEFNLRKGLLVAILSGVLSACFNFGIEAGEHLAEEAVALGYNPLFQNNATFVVLLWGGFLTNFIWCMILNYKNSSFGDYVDRKSPLIKNYLFCSLAGTIWFLQFFFYGMGESKLGNGASSWILHMVAIILVGNLWGLILKEWTDVDHKTKYTIASGIFVLLISIGIVGYGNSLA